MTAEHATVEKDKAGTALLRVHLQPRASRNRLLGLHGEALKLAVTAPPVDGKANKQTGAFLSELFGVRPADVTLVSGRQSRRKCFRFETLTADQVKEKLQALLGE